MWGQTLVLDEKSASESLLCFIVKFKVRYLCTTFMKRQRHRVLVPSQTGTAKVYPKTVSTKLRSWKCIHNSFHYNKGSKPGFRKTNPIFPPTNFNFIQSDKHQTQTHPSDCQMERLDFYSKEHILNASRSGDVMLYNESALWCRNFHVMYHMICWPVPHENCQKLSGYIDVTPTLVWFHCLVVGGILTQPHTGIHWAPFFHSCLCKQSPFLNTISFFSTCVNIKRYLQICHNLGV